MIKITKKAKALLKNDLNSELLDNVLKCTNNKFKELMNENKNATRLARKHYRNTLFPVIALFYSLLDNNIDRDKALQLTDKCYEAVIMDKRKAMILLMKIPGMYKLYPKLFMSMQKKMFNKSLGFDYIYHEASKTRCRFDMNKCFYYNICKAYKCPELCKLFCHSDDLTNDGIHKNIIWHRTKTIGLGDELCDFEISIRRKANK